MKMQVKLYSGNLTTYAAHVHTLNHQWWHDAEGNRLVRSHPELLALVMSELSEGLEGIRKNLKDDHLPHYSMLHVELADTVIRLLDLAGSMSLDLVGGEFSDSMWIEKLKASEAIWHLQVRVAGLETVKYRSLGHAIGGIISACWSMAQQFCKGDDTAFWQVVYDKLVYNQNRADHKHEARALDGGKKF
jgi:hypothetical protein